LNAHVSSPKSGTERTRSYRRRLAEQGIESINVAVDRAIASRLRTMAREHKQSMGAVLKVASMLAERALAEHAPAAAE
jgi:hypothetical protein